MSDYDSACRRQTALKRAALGIPPQTFSDAMIPKILSVDDSRMIRLVVGRSLKEYNCTVFEASNGEEGLAVIRREKPDLIILDITMPVMDGVEMLGHLRAQKKFAETPVIMLTAESTRENVTYLAGMGIKDYLVKPFKDHQLLEKILRVLPLEKLPMEQDL